MSAVAAGLPLAIDDAAPQPRSFAGEVYRRFRADRTGTLALLVLLLIVLAAVAAPLLTAYDPLVGDVASRLRGIGAPGHVLGTDEQGRDIWTRLLYGGRLSLITGIAPVFGATLVGTAIGATVGLRGGRLGTTLMRIMDMCYAFPSILLAIALVASLGPGIINSILALTIVYIPPISRVAESATRGVVIQEYVEAARVSGANAAQIITYQVLPNIFSPIFVYASGLIGLAIVAGSGLSYLGLGAAPPAPEWGAMLSSLQGSIYQQPWIVALPGLFIFVTSVASNVLTNSLRDALDTKATDR
ncbi:MAG: ABC transporter permease [Chloroflexota bacterium]